MKPAPFNIFIAYIRKDTPYLDELRIHLTPLERTVKVKVWYDGRIEPGAACETAIKENLHAAHIILLLVSAQAIASDYFYEKEMTDSLERHEKGEARVVPLIIRPCAWRATPLAKLQALPKNAKPVSSWPDRDVAWNDAVEALLNLIEERDQKVKSKIETNNEVDRQTSKKEATTQKPDDASTHFQDQQDFMFRHLSSRHLPEPQRKYREEKERKKSSRKELPALPLTPSTT